MKHVHSTLKIESSAFILRILITHD